MLVLRNKRKPILEFLLHRWRFLASLAAVERVWHAGAIHAQENDLPVQPIPLLVSAQPTKQITLIKQYIIFILPEAKFIDYNYEAPCPLDPRDFMELYTNEQSQCIDKVQELMEKLKIQ